MSFAIDPIEIGAINILVLKNDRVEKDPVNRCALDVIANEVVEGCDLEPPTVAVPVAGKGYLV